MKWKRQKKNCFEIVASQQVANNPKPIWSFSVSLTTVSHTKCTALVHGTLWRIDSSKALPDVLNICRSIRLQSRSSAASVWYLGHTPITARLRDELCRGNIFMEWSHFFESCFELILRPHPSRGSAQQSGSWHLGWLGFKVDLSV